MRRPTRLIALLLALIAAPALAAKDHPRTYLLSLKNLRIGAKTPRLTQFHVETWGVTFDAVCRIPAGWRMKAGSWASPDGEIDGEASQGVTWLNQKQLTQIGPLFLITLFGPVLAKKIVFKDGTGEEPATFDGTADIEDFNDDKGKTVKLTSANIRLTPARQCPPLPRR